MSDNNKIEEVQKLLGTPFSGDLPDNALKVRRNLLAVSLVIITLLVTGAKIDPNSTLFGIKFTDLKVEHVPWGLLILNAYFFTHFLWYAVEAWQEWRLRLTGMKVAFQTGAKLASNAGDYPGDPRQSTLYNWWLNESHKIHGMQKQINEMAAKIAQFEAQAITTKTDMNGLNYAHAATKPGSITAQISSLQRQLQSLSTTLESARIPASLKRFDNWFHLSVRTQSLRWIIVDLSLPIFLGMTANALLIWTMLS